MGLLGWWSACALLLGGLMLAQESSAHDGGKICMKLTKVQVLSVNDGTNEKQEFFVKLIESNPSRKGKSKEIELGGISTVGFRDSEVPDDNEFCFSWSDPDARGVMTVWEDDVFSPNDIEIKNQYLPRARHMIQLNCNQKKLVEVESKSTILPYNLEECEGNCFLNSDCARNLNCFRYPTGNEEENRVPGCSGEMKENYGYCFKPVYREREFTKARLDASIIRSQVGHPTDMKYINDYPKGSGLLRECEGTCANDGDCFPDLKCSPANVHIHGCLGLPESGTRYCYRPRHLKTIITQTPWYALGECQGSCISDSDCGGSMSCFQQATKEKTVPGCIGNGWGRNYCYYPTGYYDLQDVLAECKSKSQVSKFKNGCTAYAEGWGAKKNDCHLCTDTTKAYNSKNLGQCHELCRDLYMDTNFVSGQTCKRGCDWLHSRLTGQIDRQDALGRCQDQSRVSKFKNGCTAYAEGWGAKKNGCHSCTDTTRVFDSHDIGECEALCGNMYRDSLPSSRDSCKSGCGWFHNLVTDTGFFNEKNKKGCQGAKYYGKEINVYLDMYTKCEKGSYGISCKQCDCNKSEDCDDGIDGKGCVAR